MRISPGTRSICSKSSLVVVNRTVGDSVSCHDVTEADGAKIDVDVDMDAKVDVAFDRPLGGG